MEEKKENDKVAKIKKTINSFTRSEISIVIGVVLGYILANTVFEEEFWNSFKDDYVLELDNFTDKTYEIEVRKFDNTLIDSFTIGDYDEIITKISKKDLSKNSEYIISIPGTDIKEKLIDGTDKNRYTRLKVDIEDSDYLVVNMFE